jgi:hypothetical protein
MSLDRLDGPIRLAGIEAGVPPVSALPDRFPPGRAVPWPGEDPAARGETPPQRAAGGRGRRHRGARRGVCRAWRLWHAARSAALPSRSGTRRSMTREAQGRSGRATLGSVPKLRILLSGQRQPRGGATSAARRLGRIRF